jgi:hypothetical protein
MIRGRTHRSTRRGGRACRACHGHTCSHSRGHRCSQCSLCYGSQNTQCSVLSEQMHVMVLWACGWFASGMEWVGTVLEGGAAAAFK